MATSPAACIYVPDAEIAASLTDFLAEQGLAPILILDKAEAVKDHPHSLCLLAAETDTRTIEASLAEAQPAIFFLNAGAAPPALPGAHRQALTCPVHLSQLAAALRRLPRQPQQFSLSEQYQFRPLNRDIIDQQGDRACEHLTEKESQLLVWLLRHPGEFFSRDALLQSVWGYDAAMTTHTLETHIYRLRSKLEPLLGAACGIATEERGYGWLAQASEKRL